MVLFALIQVALAQGVNNPGGARIPYVKLQSGSWDVVIRMTGPGRARIERVKARCDDMWVNGCSPGVDPELRRIALNGVFQSNVQLSGDFSYCSTAVLREIPANMAKGFVNPSTEQFCQAFLNPEAVRGMRSGTATRGENDLVNRLMGGQNTTSGKIRIKAPPTLEGAGGAERLATGERRTAEQTRANQRTTAPEPTRREPPVAAPEPVESFIEEDVPTPASVRPEPSRPTPPEPTRAAVPPPVPAPSRDLLAEEEEEDIFGTTTVPPLEPAPKPTLDASFDPLALDEDEMDMGAPAADIDAELAELLAPLPGLPPEDQVVVPAPRPPQQTRKMTEMERLEAENLDIEPITKSEDDEKKKKNRKKEEEPTMEVGSDDDLGDYIIIDIEDLPED